MMTNMFPTNQPISTGCNDNDLWKPSCYKQFYNRFQLWEKLFKKSSVIATENTDICANVSYVTVSYATTAQAKLYLESHMTWVHCVVLSHVTRYYSSTVSHMCQQVFSLLACFTDSFIGLFFWWWVKFNYTLLCTHICKTV